MLYEWDSAKAKSNFVKHSVRFSDAVAIFEDDAALTLEEDHAAEDRYVTIGMDMLGRMLVVVYTWRRDVVRIISARKATKRERRQYEG